MKKIFSFFRHNFIFFVSCLLTCICISSCSLIVELNGPPKGKTENATIDYGSSEKFSEEEIQAAVDTVLDGFPNNHSGCDLLRLWYDEKQSEEEVERYYKVEKENIIVLYGDYRTGSLPEGDPRISNSTYENWAWILTRESATEDWTITDQGY